MATAEELTTRKFITERVIQVLEFVKANKVHGIKTDIAFLNAIGIKHNSALIQIKNGLSTFTHNDIKNIVIVFNINANFIYNPKCAQMLNDNAGASALQKLKSSVKELEILAKGKL